MAHVIHQSVKYPGYWRIAWFGRLSESPRPGLPNLQIRVYLGKIQGPHNQISKGKLPSKLQTAFLPIGELPRLHLNAVLHDGKLISHKLKNFASEDILTRRLNTDRSNIKVFDRFTKDRGEYIIPLSNFTDQLDIDQNALFIGIGIKDDPYAIIVPAVEVFRFFYATSDVLAKALLSDQFLDPNTNLWSLANTAMDDEGRAVIWLRRRMLDADARFLARFAFDEYALKEAQNIFLYASAWGRGNTAERMVRAVPPFQGSNNFTFLCKTLKKSQNRILITRFLNCDWTPSFKELKWDRDNDGRIDIDNRDERPTTNWTPGLKTVSPNGDTSINLSTSAPSCNNVPSRLKEEEIADRFPNLGKVAAQKLPQTDAKTKSEPKSWKVLYSTAYAASVVNGKTSEELILKAVIESLEVRNKTLRSLTTEMKSSVNEEEYLIILNLLLSIKSQKLADVTFLTVLESYCVINNIEFNVYPPKIYGKESAWLYVDSEKKYRRMALLASVSNENSTRYILELQQRKHGECSTIVFWGADEKPLPYGMLTLLVMDCAQSKEVKINSAQSRGICWGRLHHSSKHSNDVEAKHYFDRIFSARVLP